MTNVRRKAAGCVFASLAFFLLIVGPATAVRAAILPGALASASEALNPGGPDAGFWRGSHGLSGSTIYGSITGTGDFAVFGPGGNFQAFLDSNYGGGTYTDPTGGAEYIYAFQFESISGNPIETLNAGFDQGANLGSLGAPQSLAVSGDVGPASTIFNDSSAQWDFNAAPVANGEVSDVLFYSSELGPKPDKLSLDAVFGLVFADSGETDFASPSEIPEPTSALIMVIGTVLGLLVGRRGDHF